MSSLEFGSTPLETLGPGPSTITVLCIKLAHRVNYIATITLDRPDADNAIDETAAHLLRDACEQVRQDDDVRVCVITGAGDAFCVGRSNSPVSERFGIVVAEE